MTVAFEGVEKLQLYSVTWLIKQALGVGEPIVTWATETTARAALQSRSTIEAMLREGGEDAALDWLIDARWRESAKATGRGSELHAAAEALVLGATPIIAPELMPYVEQLARWLKTYRPRFLMTEAPVYNREQFYAGTLDGVCVIDGVRYLVDYKTTPYGPDAKTRKGRPKSRPPYPEVALQLVAYARAIEVGLLPDIQTTGYGDRYYVFDPTAPREPMIPVDGALCIALSPYDCRAIPVRIDEPVWKAFLHAREVARFRLAKAGELFGPALVAARESEAAT